MTRHRKSPDRGVIRPISPKSRPKQSLQKYRVSNNEAKVLNKFFSRLQEREMKKEMQHRYINALNQKIRNMRTHSLKAGVPPHLLIKFTRNNVAHLL